MDHARYLLKATASQSKMLPLIVSKIWTGWKLSRKGPDSEPFTIFSGPIVYCCNRSWTSSDPYHSTRPLPCASPLWASLHNPLSTVNPLPSVITTYGFPRTHPSSMNPSESTSLNLRHALDVRSRHSRSSALIIVMLTTRRFFLVRTFCLLLFSGCCIDFFVKWTSILFSV